MKSSTSLPIKQLRTLILSHSFALLWIQTPSQSLLFLVGLVKSRCCLCCLISVNLNIMGFPFYIVILVIFFFSLSFRLINFRVFARACCFLLASCHCCARRSAWWIFLFGSSMIAWVNFLWYFWGLSLICLHTRWGHHHQWLRVCLFKDLTFLCFTFLLINYFHYVV